MFFSKLDGKRQILTDGNLDIPIQTLIPCALTCNNLVVFLSTKTYFLIMIYVADMAICLILTMTKYLQNLLKDTK